MKKWKNNLDEMQEEKMLKIEHNGFWLAFWGLFFAIFFQIVIGNGGIERLCGEIIILLIISVYVLVACLKNGLWDRKLKANLKTNLIVSLITGIVFGFLGFIVSYHKQHSFERSLILFSTIFIIIGVLLFGSLSLTTAIYKHKKKKMEEEADKEENMEK